MIANSSYLFMAGIFFLFGIYSYHEADFITAVILIWSSVVFLFLWLLHFLKVKCSRDYAFLIVRDSLFKQCVLGIILFPFYAFKYVCLVLQSFSSEGCIAHVSDKIFMGQQLLWFHKTIFTDKKINAVLDITVENREPFFIEKNKSIEYLRIPVLDRTSPTVEQLQQGVAWGLTQVNQGRNLYVHCTGGHERSATFVAALLLRSGYFQTIDEAFKKIQCTRPKARFVGDQRKILEEWLEKKELFF
ncbi:MAG: dual specificity protein phosphatase family protein [Candidatus Omnitrophica bacterium]|nr:dual specificity protein phosphatase family protein [Candidatus Omnitrophota bacterium]